MNEQRIVIGQHRFTCLTPTLVRVEFAPDGVFEERRSIVAYEAQSPVPFLKCAHEAGWEVLDTGRLQIRASEPAQAFNRLNLEIRWSDGRLMQFWCPEDRDYQNLGGTLRSLDRYGGEAAVLDGVHTATMESPDFSATTWPAWLQCEVDPLYEKLHPAAPANFNRRDWLRGAKAERNDGIFLERTFNWYKDCRKFCPGVLSAAGYYFLNDSTSAVMDADDFPVERNRPGYQDWYFFAYAKDYKQALRDFRLLSGAGPIPTHRSFGIIFSRWPAFSETEIKDMARDFNANGYPLSTLVMDMEWHKEGWGHWEFNPELIPDPARFFALCREHGLEVTFNDHPLDVRDDDCHFDAYVKQGGAEVLVREREYNGKNLKMAKVDICNKQQNRAFSQLCHTDILRLGLDYWWNDGSRGQMSATCGQLVTNKTFFEESERDGRRGMLLARYGGLGSHRYGAYFTGDTTSDFDVLRLQCEFNIRAAGVGLSNISHDLGGFCLPGSQVTQNKAGVPVINAERYVRWLQFGVFNPLVRFHSAPGSGSRLPYDYDPEVGGVCRHWLRVRHSLLPYIYSAAWEHYATGIPLTRGMFLEEPEKPAAYRFDQFYFGPSLLVAPVLAAAPKRSLYLPKGDWWEFETAKRIAGGVELTRSVALADVPVYVKAGSILPRQSPDAPLHAAHIRALTLDVYPGADGAAELYEDDGTSAQYRQGTCCRTRFELSHQPRELTLRGQVVAGTPFGAEREICAQLSLSCPPVAATVDGAPVAIEPLTTPGRWRVQLPVRPSAAPFTLRIELPC